MQLGYEQPFVGVGKGELCVTTRAKRSEVGEEKKVVIDFIIVIQICSSNLNRRTIWQET